MTGVQLSLFDITDDVPDPKSCRHVKAIADIGGGKAKCGAYGDGETWTNCVALGRCTLMKDGGKK